MKAIILAAGRGSRLKGLTDECPKGLVKLRQKPLVEITIDSLNSAGISDLALVTGYRRADFDYLGFPTFHNSKWDQTNMVSSLICAQKWLKREDVLVVYSDVIVCPDHLVELKNAAGALTITYDQDWLSLWKKRFDDVLSDAESFRTQNGKLQQIGQRCLSVNEIQGQYMGLFKLTPKAWAWCEEIFEDVGEEFCSRLSVTELFHLLLQRGYEINTIPIRGQWAEIDTPHDLEVVSKAIQKGEINFSGLKV